MRRSIEILADPRIEEIDLGDGHAYLQMKCPKCRELIQINDGQRVGFISVHHDLKDGGCGYHDFIRGPRARKRLKKHPTPHPVVIKKQQ